MSDIFREVDEAMQQDKLLAIWNEYKNTIIAAFAILIATVLLTTTYNNWNDKRDAAETARLMEAIESDTPEKILPTIIQDTRDNHAAIGIFITAAIAIDDGKKAEAATLYKQAAEDRNTPRDLRDLSRILYVQNAEDGSTDILKPLLNNDKSPWIWHAKIEAAVLAAKADNYDQALSYLEDFNDTTTIPLSLKQRGKALAHVYSLRQSEISNKEKSEG